MVYNNGDFIPSNLNNLEWSKTTSGARTTYGQEGSKCYDDTPEGQACNKYWSLAKHGFLYNAYAVMDESCARVDGTCLPTVNLALISLYNGGLEAQEAIIGRSGWASANGNNRSGFQDFPEGAEKQMAISFTPGFLACGGVHRLLREWGTCDMV